MKRAPSVGTPSIYSHTTSRSQGLQLASARSLKSLKIPWYKTPWLQNRFGEDIQKFSLFTGIYSIILGIFTICTSVFDLYCLAEATPGSSHSGYYIISFDFVYVGNKHVRNLLIMIAVLSILAGLALFVTSIMLIQALRKEHEKKMIPWLLCMFGFASFRLFAFVFCSVVNDMIFAYNVLMCLIWIGATVLNFSGLAFVYSLYLELSDLTKLEDLAHLRMGTMTSLATQSMQGSRPTTPHSISSITPYP